MEETNESQVQKETKSCDRRNEWGVPCCRLSSTWLRFLNGQPTLVCERSVSQQIDQQLEFEVLTVKKSTSGLFDLADLTPLRAALNNT